MAEWDLLDTDAFGLSRHARVGASGLLGRYLGVLSDDGEVVLRITELEAYEGENDPASHAYRGRTPRTEPMFGDAGTIYVYRSYGIHLCINVVWGTEGVATASLMRAGEVVRGEQLMAARRPKAKSPRDWARGPGNFGAALGLTMADSGAHLGDGRWRLYEGRPAEPELIRSGPRVGVREFEGSGQYPWRFWIDGDPTVTAYRPGPTVDENGRVIR